MVAVGEFALIFVLPLYLINALGLDVMGAGLVLAAMAAGAFLSGAAARHLAARFGAPGTVLIGLGLEVAGVVVLALLVGPDTSGWLVAVPLVVYGLGLGLASTQLTGTVLRDIPVEISGQGSATQSTVRQIGSALGTAVAGATLSIALAATLPAALDDAGLTGPAADSLASATRDSAGTTIPQLRAQGEHGPLGEHTGTAVDALTDGFADATRWALLIAAVFLVLGSIGALRLRRASGNPWAHKEAPGTSKDSGGFGWGERRGLNPRPSGPQPDALPTELRPPCLLHTDGSARRSGVHSTRDPAQRRIGALGPGVPAQACAPDTTSAMARASSVVGPGAGAMTAAR